MVLQISIRILLNVFKYMFEGKLIGVWCQSVAYENIHKYNTIASL